MSFDFDAVIARDGTASVKHDGRIAVFGTPDVTPLWVADMDFAAPPAVTAALVARAQHPVYGYTLVTDPVLAALQDWCRQRWGWQVPREHILLVPGVVPSLYAVVQALTAPGDGVIVQPPVYFPFFSAVRDSGRQLLENPLRLDAAGYTMDWDDLDTQAASARLLLLCSPHNPVGRVWQADELDRLLAIARRHGLTILADEIHADLILPGHRHLPLATRALDGVPVITALAPSKTFNVPGLGLSALIVPDPTQRRALQDCFASLHVEACNPFSLVAFEAAYRHGGDWLEALLIYLDATRDCVDARFRQQLPGVRVLPCEGTYLLWLDCRALGLDDAGLQARCLQAGVGLSQGRQFGAAGSGFLRLNMASPRAVILAAVDRLITALTA